MSYYYHAIAIICTSVRENKSLKLEPEINEGPHRRLESASTKLSVLDNNIANGISYSASFVLLEMLPVLEGHNRLVCLWPRCSIPFRIFFPHVNSKSTIRGAAIDLAHLQPEVLYFLYAILALIESTKLLYQIVGSMKHIICYLLMATDERQSQNVAKPPSK